MQHEASPGHRGVVCLLLAALAYAVLSVVYTWPAARLLSTHIIGGGWDGPMFLWNLWWGSFSVFQLGENPLTTEYLFYPDGTSLVFNSHAVLPAVLSAPLQALFGLIATYDLIILLTFVFSAVGAYLLVLEMVSDRRAAFVAGVAFGFCHFRTSFVMFLNLIQSQFLALFVWALWATLRRRSPRFGALTGVFAACMLYSSYNILVLALLFTSLFLVYSGAVVRRGPDAWWTGARQLALPWGVALVIFLVLGTPLFFEMQREVEAHGSYTTMGSSKSYEVTTPLQRYLVRGPLSGESDGQPLPMRQASYLGISVLGLAVLALLLSSRSMAAWFWLLVGLLFTVTSLGPTLDASGLPGWMESALQGTHLPFFHLREMPVLSEVRVAHRYGLVGALAFASLAGLGMKGLLALLERRGAGPRVTSAATVAVAALVFVDFLDLPFPRLDHLHRPPEALALIAEDPRDCSVLEYPAGRNGYTQFSYFGTIHRKPVYLDGQMARRIPHLAKKQKASVIRRALDQAFGGQIPSSIYIETNKPKMLLEARENRIGWIILAWEGRVTRPETGTMSDKRLRAMSKLVRNVFDVEETVYRVPNREVQVEDSDSADETRSRILAIYKLVLP